MFVLVLLIVAAAAVCAALAMTDNNKDKYTLSQTDDTFLMSALRGSVWGSDFDVSETQINTYLRDTLCDEEKGVLKNIRLYFHDDEDTEIYARIHYMDHDFSAYAKAEIQLDPGSGTAAVRLYSAKLGELPVPDFILQMIIEHVAKDNKYVRYSDGLLKVKTEYFYDFDTFTITLRLEKFQPHDGQLTCRTNSLSYELVVALKDYCLSEEGQHMMKDIFGSDLNDLKEDLYSAIFGE